MVEPVEVASQRSPGESSAVTPWGQVLAEFHAACRAPACPSVREIRRWLSPLPAEQQADALVDFVVEHMERAWEIGCGTKIDDYVAEFGTDFNGFKSLAEVNVDLIER